MSDHNARFEDGAKHEENRPKLVVRRSIVYVGDAEWVTRVLRRSLGLQERLTTAQGYVQVESEARHSTEDV